MSVENNVPTIRFEGFSGEWEEKALGEVTNVYDGTHQTPKYTSSGVMFLSVENIKTLKSEKFISESSFEKEFKIFPKKNDVLMTRIGDVGTANVVESDARKAYYVTLTLLKHKELDPYFLKNSIGSNNVRKDIWHRTLHIAFPKKINMNEIAKVMIPKPIEEKEQTKIGNYFQQLDTLIAQHQQKHDKLLNLKKALLEKMFPKQDATEPEIRFKGFSGEWEERALGAISTSFSGGTPQVGNEEYYKGKIPFIRSGEINSNSTEMFISELGLKNSSAKLVSKGCILYALYGATSGEVGLSKINGAINQAVLVIFPDSETSSGFIMQWLRKSKAQIIGTYLQGGQGNLSGTIVKNLVLNLPNHEEQTKIGNLFKQLDTLISQHQTQFKKLGNIKQACLEKMFV